MKKFKHREPSRRKGMRIMARARMIWGAGRGYLPFVRIVW
jgi:hypothetical protein